MEHMLREERLWHIAQMLHEKQQVVSSELAEAFGLNIATIRLDLAELEQRGVAKRVYGGAVLAVTDTNGAKLTLNESPFAERLNLQRAEKEAIGQAVVGLIHDGETIMIDGGSTTYQVCRHLTTADHLTVISCAAINLWEDLLSKSNIQLFLTGGFLRPESLSMVGDFSNNMLRSFRASKAILGIDGISLENGFTALNFLEADIKRSMIAASEELIIVADHSKFGKVCPIPVAALKQASTIVTDVGISLKFVKELERSGVEVIVANPAEIAITEHEPHFIQLARSG
jgi:DeoR family fructose operon transcriptional repressor